MGSAKSLTSEEPDTSSSRTDLHRLSDSIDSDVSLNYSIAKVIAIFTVVAGHWFTGTVLWIPVTFGLFVFAFSSAYFTSKIYGVDIDRQRFWKKKLERLGLRFWVILCVLAVVISLKGGTVLHWHTATHFFGLSGFLNWFSVPNKSSFGAGLWFFTLLLLFYLTYPYLAKLCSSAAVAKVIAVVAFICAVLLEESVQVGHELWLTTLGFVLGIVYGLHEPGLPARYALILAALTCFSLLGVNLMSDYKQLNTVLIAATSLFISLWLSKARFPRWRIVTRIAELEKYLLEIFLMHTYLFVHLMGHSMIDFLLSSFLILAAAVLVNKAVALAGQLVFGVSGATRG